MIIIRRYSWLNTTFTNVLIIISHFKWIGFYALFLYEIMSILWSNLFTYYYVKKKPCNQYKVLHIHLAPSEGIEPPAEEPESSVLSITPRGLYFIKYEQTTNRTDCIFYYIMTYSLYKSPVDISTMNVRVYIWPSLTIMCMIMVQLISTFLFSI